LPNSGQERVFQSARDDGKISFVVGALLSILTRVVGGREYGGHAAECAHGRDD
jgi:hypothetical protein